MQLSNGINVVYHRMQGYKSVCVGVWVKAGSSNENERNNGISHFIEHMVFKGTKNRSAKDIALIIDGIGGELNAYTAKECTCYYVKLMGSDLKTGLDVLSDIVLNASFDEEHIETEKTVVVDEINMYEDSAEDLVADMLTEITFGKHPLSFPILGTKSTVNDFSKTDLIDYYKQHYVANKTVISIAGDFDEGQLAEWCEHYFAEMPSGESHSEDVIDPPVFHSDYGFKYKDNEQVQVSIDLPGLKFDDDRSYELMLLSNVFGGTNSSMLFQRIREDEGLSYSIFSEPSFYDDIGTLNISFGVSKDNLKEIVKLIVEVMNQLKSNKLNDEIIDHAKAHLRGSFVLGLEGTDNFMDLIGRLELFAQKEKDFNEMFNRIDEISTDKVNDLIELCFDKEKVSLAIVGDIDDKTVHDIHEYIQKNML